jgi:protein disulfide-isomerase A1
LKTTALGFAALATVALAAIETEEGVLVLTDDNFDEALAEHPALLVEFYAPWCGHCKNLAPEYAKAAEELGNMDPPMYVAKVDATAATEVGKKYEIQGFPTLKFFKNGAVSEYQAGRTAKDIVDYVVKKSGPTVQTVESADALKKITDDNEVVVIAAVDSFDGDKAAIFEKAAGAFDDITYVAVTDADLVSEYNLAVGEVVAVRKFDEPVVKFEGDFVADAITSFAKDNSMPLVVTFSQDKASQIFGGGIDVHMLVFADADADYYTELVDGVKGAASENKGEIMHIVIPPSEDRILDFFGLKEADLPAITLVNMAEGMKKYPYTGALDASTFAEDVAAFEKKYLAGDLKPVLKSAEPVDDSDEAVKVIVGKDFEERVVESDKDVLLEFYAPWCGHCKQLAPKYEELAERFADEDQVLIAKMDATENEVDHPGVDVKGFPTILFFPAGDKQNPQVYEGARDVEGMASFLKENAKNIDAEIKDEL